MVHAATAGGVMNRKYNKINATQGVQDVCSATREKWQGVKSRRDAENTPCTPFIPLQKG